MSDGKIFVGEGDEYDSAFFDKGPKFLHYNPSFLIISNIEFDHAAIDLRLLSMKILKALVQKKYVLTINNLAFQKASQNSISANKSKIAENVSNYDNLHAENEHHEKEYKSLEEFQIKIKALQEEVEKFQQRLTQKLADSSTE